MMPTRLHPLRADHGFTLVEMLVATLIGGIVTMAAVSFLIFATEDTSHITARVTADQTGRTAMQYLMSELHSACVAPSVTPIIGGSNESTIKFVSETGTQSAVENVAEHEVIYTPGTSTTEGTLVEKEYPSTNTTPPYTWSTTAKATRRLLKGVKKTEYEGHKTPVFEYYRYYHEGDTIPTGHKYGEIDETYLPSVTETEAKGVTMVKVSFTVAPEGKEAVSFNHDRPVVLEDNAVFRLAPASESASNSNLPCTERT